MIRSGNEDNFAVDVNDARGVFMVADGMGGHAAGEVASEMAVQIVVRELHALQDLDATEAGPQLGAALVHANR
ncbi:MAG: PP2C family protein-serine/threonine phosphatase, partial [Gemmatimonadaceae bacterium]